MTPPEQFKLRASDLESDTWGRLKKYLTDRREYLRGQLELDQDERTTANTRGHLAEIRTLLDLEKR